jgi:hypothetical protein
MWSMLKLLVKVGGTTLAALAILVALPLVLRSLSLPVTDFLETTRVILAWPVAILVLGLVLLLRFRDAIAHSIRHGRWTFGSALQVQAQEKPVTSGQAPSADEQEQLTKLVKELQHKYQAADMQARESLSNAIQWEFKFLDLFLVPATRAVLSWFAQLPMVTRPMYDDFWQGLPDRERRTILEVLLGHHLVTDQHGQMRISAKGRVFLGTRFLPKPHGPGD